MNSKVRSVFLGVVVISLLIPVGCKSPSDTVADSTPMPPEVEVVDITEDDTVSNQLTQHKTFDQCDSASPFEAEIRFSQANSEETRRELVIGVEGGADIGMSEVAKAVIRGSIEGHFAKTVGRESGHEEGVKIRVPARTKQEYTIVWREIRREGTVKYVEGGEQQDVGYSYRVGLELVSAKGSDLACPNQEESRAEAELTSTPYPTYTPYPTHTPHPTPVPPTATPIPTEPPAPKPQSNTGLAIGEWYSKGNVSIGVTNYSLHDWSSTIGPILIFDFGVENISKNTISFNWGPSNFRLTDNLGNSYPLDSSLNERLILNPGEMEIIKATDLRFRIDHANPAITEATLIVSNLSSVDKAEWVIPLHH
jgi:hypothetical protein